MTPLVLLVLLATPGGVTSVVVYPDRARVTRVGSVECPAAGPVVFDDVPPAAGLSTLRARADRGVVEGLTVQRRSRESSFGPQVREVEASLRTLEAEMAGDTDRVAVAENQKQLADRYVTVAREQLGRELALPRPDTRAWTTALDAALKERLDAVVAEVAARARLRERGARLEALRAQLATLAASAKQELVSAEVLVRCDVGRATVALTYVVGGVSWTPAYEVWPDEAGKAVELVSLATVRQTTGEDWDAVHLTLSTAVPYEDAQPPELKKLQLSTVEQPEPKKVLVQRAESVRHASDGRSAVEAAPSDMGIRSEGLSIQLVVPERTEVKGDGTAARLRIARTPMRARFSLVAQPNLRPEVFRVAEVTNDAPFPLLAGPVDVFGRTGFLGRLELRRVASGAKFRVTFGVDASLRVTREVVEEIKRAEGLFRDRVRFGYGYRFKVANPGAQGATVELLDHIPVSELTDVRVEIDASTTPGFTQQADDGMLRWTLQLPPASTREVLLRYHVDVPTSYDMAGL